MRSTTQNLDTLSNKNTGKPHIVLVDDDPVFALLLKHIADHEQLQLTVICSPKEAYRTLPALDFDVGLFDYDLGLVTGVQLTNFLQREGRKVPVLLVSHLGEIESWKWPVSVKSSISKKTNPYSILSAVQKVYQKYKREDG